MKLVLDPGLPFQQDILGQALPMLHTVYRERPELVDARLEALHLDLLARGDPGLALVSAGVVGLHTK